MNKPASLLVSLPLLAPLPAGAAGSYVALDFMFSEYKERDAGVDTVRPTALTVRYGRHLTPALSLEGRAGTGIASDSEGRLATTVEVSIESVAGVYLRAETAPENDVALYALAGITTARVEAENSGSAVNGGTDTDLSLGFGLEAEISKDISFSFEFIQIADKRNFDFSALTLGLKLDI